ncbi:hypothetical protein TNIN_27891 [Trichonephila inaurata madagascariensis]|uniref:C2H2-type domain-containing protein n=1 Tax=Trichonephila inaurata madagascariensis TaxID=2747483 RepID=A0A8X6XM24_9ARAC|nr:hypothetical protein TNIN_27891 [Trichonephila inaurata madagascariensis]
MIPENCKLNNLNCFKLNAFSMGSRHSIHLNTSHCPTSASNFKEFSTNNFIIGVEVLTELYDLRSDGYFCRICSFARPSLSSLKKHLQTHNIGRPYSCKVCNKSFTLKGNLKTHIRMHTALEEMITQLIELYSRHRYVKGGRRSALSPQRLIARHFPSLVPSTGKKKAAQRKCFVCQHTTQKTQKRSETRSCGSHKCNKMGYTMKLSGQWFVFQNDNWLMDTYPERS